MINQRNLPIINAFLISFYLSLTSISSIITAFIIIPNISVILSLITILLSFLFNNKIHVNKIAINVYLLILFLLVCSALLNGFINVINYLLFYLSFATTSLILTSLTINYKFVVKFTLLINIIYLIIFYFFLLNSFLNSENYGVEQMGIAYSFVPYVLISIIYIIENIKNNILGKFKIIFTLGLLLVNLYFVLFYTITRGAIIAIVIGVITLIFLYSNKSFRRIILLVLSSFIILFSIFSIQLIEIFFDSFQETSIGALNKLLNFYESDNISNGRDELFNSALYIIKDSYFLGKGIGFFEKSNESLYVHQLILQFLCEYGLIGTILFLFPLIRFYKKVLSTPINNFNCVYIAFFCSIIIMLLFSNVYWLVPNFWILYFFIWNTKNSSYIGS